VTPDPSAPTLNEFTREQLMNMKTAFESLDKDGSGKITASEMHQVLVSLGLRFTDDDVKKLIRVVDRDESGNIDFSAFSSLMANKLGGAPDENIAAELVSTNCWLFYCYYYLLSLLFSCFQYDANCCNVLKQVKPLPQDKPPVPALLVQRHSGDIPRSFIVSSRSKSINQSTNQSNQSNH
jgi:hypothetical protein